MDNPTAIDKDHRNNDDDSSNEDRTIQGEEDIAMIGGILLLVLPREQHQIYQTMRVAVT